MTTLDFSTLQTIPRLLVEATLKPVQGERFQPTGFADLGAARFTLSDGTDMLLVESAQSVANRLEAAVWDEAKGDLIGALRGLPYVRVTVKSKSGLLGVTTTLQESHRLNSAYLWSLSADPGLEAFRQSLSTAVGVKIRKTKTEKANSAEGAGAAELNGILDQRKIARGLFHYDPNTVLHGAFLEKIDGRLRLPRALSGFIEARNVRVAESGGVKNDRVDPSGDSAQGFANVPFHRTEFVAESITAFFNLDLALIRGYGLGNEATDLLIALALLKVRLFLENGLRLRTACDLDVVGAPRVTRPSEFILPSTEALLQALPNTIAACGSLLAAPAITDVSGTYEKKAKKASATAVSGDHDDAEDEEREE